MAKIPLRTYLQEIERLVDSQRLDEAVAHSRFILQFYPKYVHVYRILGKSYLEAKRYGDAADIFQRVLSSIPEDYVSNAGMSIIREDEGNLDEAIWHMERAFEIEPSNSTIQDELRRLIGKRDGIEPQRIRLTRGALARMYMKGDLTQEAITELRIALTEDTNRLDLKALLAVALYRLGQRVEAIDVANQVLRKLPNNLDSNRIMAELLAGTDRDVEAQGFRKIVIELDPYFNYVSPSTPIAEQVPNQAVSIERLEWKAIPAQPVISEQPAWVPLDSPSTEPVSSEEAVPVWLSARQDIFGQEEFPAEIDEFPVSAEINLEEESGEPIIAESGETTAAQAQEELPDWMVQAGWVPLSAEVASEISSPEKDFGEQENTEDDLIDSQIPEWLSESPAASELNPESEPLDVNAEEALPEWVFEKETSIASDNQLPPWLAETPAEDQLVEGNTASTGEGLPGWLFVEESSQDGEVGQSANLPDWLMEGAATQESTTENESKDLESSTGGIPTWLFEEDTSSDEVAIMPEVEKIPEIYDLSEAVVVDQEGISIEDEEDSAVPIVAGAAILAAALSDKEPEPAPSPEPQFEQPKTTIRLPAWLLESRDDSKSTSAGEPATMEDAELIESSIEEMEHIDLPSSEGAGDFPAWLLDDNQVTAENQAGEQIPEEIQAADAWEIPEWLAKLEEPSLSEGDTQPSKFAKAAETSFPGEEIPAETISGLSDESSAVPPTWLLAALAEQETRENEPLPVISDNLSESEGFVEPVQASPQTAEELFPEWLIEDELQPGQISAAPAEGVEGVVLPEESSIDYQEITVDDLEVTEISSVAEQSIQAEIEPERSLRAEIMSQELLEEAEGSEEPIELSDELILEQPAEEVPLDMPEWLVAPAEERATAFDWSPPPVPPMESVNLNTASLVEFERIPGVGFIRAQNIISYRENNGPFVDLVDLSNVPGMTSDIFESIKEYVYIEEQAPGRHPVEEAVREPVNVEALPEDFVKARSALAQEDIDLAISGYSKLIESHQYLPEIIQDLKEAVDKNSENPDLWLSLGDAYIRSNQVQEALNAYRQAEKLLI